MIEERQNNHVPWGLVDIILVFAASFGIVLIAGEIITFGLKAMGVKDEQTLQGLLGLIGTFIQNGSFVVLSYLFVTRKYNYSLRKLFASKNKVEILVNGIVGGIAILFGVMVINSIMAVIFMNVLNYVPPQQPIITLLLETKNQLFFLGYAVLIIVAAPIAEELFFRGLVYTYLRDKYGVRLALLVSSAFFGLMHMSVWAFMGTFLGGLGLALLYEKSKSLYTSILAHMVWNGIVTMVIFLYWTLGL